MDWYLTGPLANPSAVPHPKQHLRSTLNQKAISMLTVRPCRLRTPSTATRGAASCFLCPCSNSQRQNVILLCPFCSGDSWWIELLGKQCWFSHLQSTIQATSGTTSYFQPTWACGSHFLPLPILAITLASNSICRLRQRRHLGTSTFHCARAPALRISSPFIFMWLGWKKAK